MRAKIIGQMRSRFLSILKNRLKSFDFGRGPEIMILLQFNFYYKTNVKYLIKNIHEEHDIMFERVNF